MKAAFALVPLATLAIVSPVHATVYLSVEQAQHLLFPGATFTPAFVTLSKEQAAAIEKASGVSVRDRDLRRWRVSGGGWFIVDQVVGRHDFIPYALALDADGAVKGIEILEYRETFGGQVREPAWRAQFTGKRAGAALELKKDIQNISGATLSCRHLADGIKRVLYSHALLAAAD